MGEGVSTPWGYGKLDEQYDNFKNVSTKDARPLQIAEAMKNGSVEGVCNNLYNIFEEVVPAVQPYVNRLKETMLAGGAKASMMSGSGPSVFGIFEELSAAERVCETLTAMGAAAFVCFPRPGYKIG